MDMNILLESLNEQCVNANLSIGELRKDVSCPVRTMKVVETKFGTAVACVLYEDSIRGTASVFLPKSIRLSAEASNVYKRGEGAKLSIIFRGMKNRSFVIGFERNLL